MKVYPNPNDGDFIVKFNLTKIAETKISIYSLEGKKIEEKILTNLTIGENTYIRRIRNLDKGGTFIITIETPYEKAIQKIVIEP
jgi:hypothetical protein